MENVLMLIGFAVLAVVDWFAWLTFTLGARLDTWVSTWDVPAVITAVVLAAFVSSPFIATQLTRTQARQRARRMERG